MPAGPFFGNTPTMALTSVDLPLLEWPAKAISGSTCLNTGHCLLADVRCAAKPDPVIGLPLSNASDGCRVWYTVCFRRFVPSPSASTASTKARATCTDSNRRWCCMRSISISFDTLSRRSAFRRPCMYRCASTAAASPSLSSLLTVLVVVAVVVAVVVVVEVDPALRPHLGGTAARRRSDIGFGLCEVALFGDEPTVH
jgi:hypothetical protein